MNQYWHSQHRGLGLTNVSRTVLADGDYHEVACAVLCDGVSSPVVELLAQLKEGNWPDPNISEFPDEYQANTRRRFLAQVAHLADFGELEQGFNRLDGGIWEFKVESLRVTFFDTPGDGTFTPKFGEEYDSWDGRRLVEFPTDFDEFIRVGHYFGKDGQKAPPEDVKRSIEVREEDVAHDRDDEEQFVG